LRCWSRRRREAASALNGWRMDDSGIDALNISVWELVCHSMRDLHVELENPSAKPIDLELAAEAYTGTWRARLQVSSQTRAVQAAVGDAIRNVPH